MPCASYRRTARLIPILIALTGTWGSTTLAQSAPAATYTDAQARRGRVVYDEQCARCHGSSLEGSQAIALAGDAFRAKWGAPTRSLADLFYTLRTTMPYGAGGTLARADYVRVLAYMLERNGAGAGTRELPSDDASLRALHFPAEQQAKGEKRDVAANDTPASSDVVRAPSKPQMGPTQRELATADANHTDWLYGTHDYSGGRYAQIDQITPANVKSLRPVCVYQAGSLGAFHTNPLVHRGVMYLTTRHTTVAIDAKTCAVQWRHSWDPSQRAMAQANRGVAIKDGRVVRGTADGRLITFDAATGDVLWERKAADRARGEMFNMAPVIFEDLVIIGPAGSELGFRGWIGAFRLSDGSPVWRFDTVPRPGEPGSETWPTETAAERGGGAIWTPLALDVETGVVFVPTTNPAPDFAGDVRAGANLYTNSVLALDARTGKLLWARQLIPHDTHDWDVTQAGPLFTARIGGVERKLVAGAAKDGFLHALDRKTGEVVWKTAVSKRENAELPLTPEGVHVCPGILGGVQWNGAAFSPRSGLLYIPSVDWCATFKVDKDEPPFVAGSGYMGGSFTLDPVSTSRGWLSAIDAATGAIRWRRPSSAPMLGAVTATSTGLLLTGEVSGDFLALDASNGRTLYRFPTGGAVAGGVITYVADGQQYVAVMSGGLTSFWGRPDGAATVIVFGLR